MNPLDTRTGQSQGTRSTQSTQTSQTSRSSSADFSKALDKRPPPVSSAQSANERVAGWKTLEAALHKSKESEVGNESSLKRFAAYGDLAKTVAGMKKSMRRIGDPVMEGMQESMEINAESNMRYLEMQQHMQEESITHECLSNLMKARSEAVKNSISTIQ